MNIKSVLSNIPNKEGAGYFTVFLPTLDKEVRIRHLSVNDQKIISKLAIEDNPTTFASEADLAKISIVETNSLEPIELEQIDVRDYFILCCALRKENYMDEFKVEYSCPKCTEDFFETIDFAKLIENATEYEQVITKKEISSGAGNTRVTVGIPAQLDLIMLEMYYARIAATRDVTPAEKYVDFVICCIKDIEMETSDGVWESVEDFKTLSYLAKVEFIQQIKCNIESVAKLFNDIGMITSNFFYDIKCPNCGNKLNTFMDTSDFFML